MNIGIDVDGTLTDIGRFQLEKGEKYFDRSAVDPDAFDIEQIFGCSPAERDRFWKKNIWGYCITYPCIDGAAKAIRRMRRDGHRIVIITSRVFTTEKGLMGFLFRKMLTVWLRRNGIVYDDIVYCNDTGEAKLGACKEKNIDVMIDDKPENLMKISGQLRVICYPAPWNKELKSDDIIRPQTWSDIYRLIKNGGKRNEQVS